jgi:uncharacterized protein YbaA (DUF1428 family)
MKMMPSRRLAAHPGVVWKELSREGAVVITKDGVPRGIILPTSDATFIEDVQELVFSRARRAVSAIRENAARTGLDELSSADIDHEIRTARIERKRKQSK